MGKDNILFHSILFPSTLISTSLKSNKTDYNLVNKLCVTEYLRYEGGKFSKSQNRGVFGNDCA
jgi:methionyl-tRNA synthetase